MWVEFWNQGIAENSRKMPTIILQLGKHEGSDIAKCSYANAHSPSRVMIVQ